MKTYNENPPQNPNDRFAKFRTENGVLLLNRKAFAEWLDSDTVQRKIKLIQNHHTWRPDYSNFKGDNHFSLVAGMKRSHLNRGFSDIAQNLTTFPDGFIAVGRSLNTIPAGIRGANSNGICIEHVGNFDIDGDEMSEEHKKTIVFMNALLCEKFDLPINTDSIVYHHWWTAAGKRTNGFGAAKSCPGTNFFGGNSVEACETNFIPLIKTAL